MKPIYFYEACCKIFFCFVFITISSQSHVADRSTEIISLKLKESKDDYNTLAKEIAEIYSLDYLGQVGLLKGHYAFGHKNGRNVSHTLLELEKHITIEWQKHEKPLIRVKRTIVPDWHTFKDPLFHKQWHLHNYNGYLDCNVTGVWEKNITGKGVVVAIVDDGVEWNHPDLKDNYCPEGSFDINSNDEDPSPRYDEEEKNKHGTRCAGEVAAVPNSVCGVGIAFGAQISGIRAIDGPTTDASEAVAFNKYMDVNDVYSCSWGPEDDAQEMDGPHALGRAALEHGVVAGRNGFGSIFVVASGNGGPDDNCDFDGYANSMYTITIAALDEFGTKPSYSEACNSMLGTTLSSGTGRNIATTDWNGGCTDGFSGTSAATPLVAGMVALMLESRPCLTWRDVQHIIAFTGKRNWKGQSIGNDDWVTNKAGFMHSSSHGFGFLDSWKLVNAARVWESVPMLVSLRTDPAKNQSNIKIPVGRKNALTLTHHISKSEAAKHLLNSLEYILITVNINHANRGKLSFEFECPSDDNGSGTKSVFSGRKLDKSKDGFKNWAFSTVKCWGEKPYGTFKFKIIDKRKVNETAGTLKSWSVTMYGSQMTQQDIEERRMIISDAFDGKYLSSDSNYTVHCPIGVPLEFDVTSAIQDRTLKLVVMLSAFFVFWAVYYSIEMTFCNAEDKTDNKPNENTESNNNPQSADYGGIDMNTNTSNNTTTTFQNPVFTTIDMDDVPLNEQQQNQDLGAMEPSNQSVPVVSSSES